MTTSFYGWGIKNALWRKPPEGVKHTELWKFIPEFCVFQITWCGPDGDRTRD
jgi:hypothetical protein